MNLNLGVLNLASQLASHAYKRQELLAQNIANADTPGYKARDLSEFKVSAQSFDASIGMRKTHPAHLGRDVSTNASEEITTSVFGSESPNGNTVSLEDQLVRSSEVQHQHEMALGIYQKSLAILRLGLGRRS